MDDDVEDILDFELSNKGEPVENLFELFNSLISELPPIDIAILKDSSPSCHYQKRKSLEQGLFVDQLLQRFPETLIYSEKMLSNKESMIFCLR